MLLPLLLLLSVPLLLAASAEDAYTACACVRRRLMRRPCPPFVRHAVPSCAPGVAWRHCERLCCHACLAHEDRWPVCRSAALRTRCDRYARPDPDGADSSDDESYEEHHDDQRDHVVGPKMQTAPQPPTPWATYPEQSPGMYLDDDEFALPSPSIAHDATPEPELEPSPEAALSPSEDPYAYTPEATFDAEAPQPTPDARGAAGRVQPPFDATNEGELDLAPSDGRPFAPAACECMSRGARCDHTLAAASGVCRPRVPAVAQGPDCHFACCRICTVNKLATYCDDAPIVQACRL